MSKSKEVNAFLDNLAHPLRTEIDYLRELILSAHAQLEENVKWNGPNFVYEGEDRITMRIHPPKQVQLIFHRGAKVKKQPETRLIEDTNNLLEWRGNDRAIIGFKTIEDLKKQQNSLQAIIVQWLAVN